MSERLDELARWAASEEAECLQDDMPVSAGYYADIIKLIAARRAANTPVDGVASTFSLTDQTGNVLYSHPTTSPAAEPVAWMRRWAFDGIDVMAIKPPSARPKGWQFHEITRVKIAPDDVPLTHPAPSASREVTEAAAELIRRVRDVLDELGPGGYLLPAGAAKTNYLEAACNQMSALLAALNGGRENG